MVPPSGPWCPLRAWQPTWLANPDPAGIGRHLRDERLDRRAERQAAGDLRLRLRERCLGGEHIGPSQVRRLGAVFGCT